MSEGKWETAQPWDMVVPRLLNFPWPTPLQLLNRATMIDQVPPAALAQWFAQDPSAPAVLVDVREPWERETASVTPGASRWSPSR